MFSAEILCKMCGSGMQEGSVIMCIVWMACLSFSAIQQYELQLKVFRWDSNEVIQMRFKWSYSDEFQWKMVRWASMEGVHMNFNERCSNEAQLKVFGWISIEGGLVSFSWKCSNELKWKVFQWTSMEGAQISFHWRCLNEVQLKVFRWIPSPDTTNLEIFGQNLVRNKQLLIKNSWNVE